MLGVDLYLTSTYNRENTVARDHLWRHFVELSSYSPRSERTVCMDVTLQSSCTTSAFSCTKHVLDRARRRFPDYREVGEHAFPVCVMADKCDHCR